MIGLFATTCPFPISGISPSETGEFCFRFRVLLFYATHPTTGITRKYEETADRYRSFEAAEDRRESGSFSKIYHIQAV